MARGQKTAYTSPSVHGLGSKATVVEGAGSLTARAQATSCRCCTTTRPRLFNEWVSVNEEASYSRKLTRVVPPNRGLHDLLHPVADGDLLGGAEVVRAVRVVHDFKPKLARVDVGVGEDTVPGEIDEALDLLLLRSRIWISTAFPRASKKENARSRT